MCQRLPIGASAWKPPPNAKVGDGSQPPVTFDLSLSESAGARSLDRLFSTNAVVAGSAPLLSAAIRPLWFGFFSEETLTLLPMSPA
jgi:hypothetical protein